MSIQADLVLYDRRGRLSTVVEVKNKRGTTVKWASDLRRNIAEHGFLQPPDYFLLVTPDSIYLWKDAHQVRGVVPPDFVAEAEPILLRYYERAGVDPGNVTGQAFELVVAAWLSDLVSPSEEPQNEPWLRDSGLLNAASDGRVGYQVAA